MKDKDGHFSAETITRNVETNITEPVNGVPAKITVKKDLESIVPTSPTDNIEPEVPIESLISNPQGSTMFAIMTQTETPVKTESHVGTENTTEPVNATTLNPTKPTALASEHVPVPVHVIKPLLSRPVMPVVQLPENNPAHEHTAVKPTNEKKKAHVETKSCVVRIEILTEADIVKDVHVHSNSQPTAPIKVKDATLETVETVETKYRTRSSVCTKPPHSTKSLGL